MKIDTTSNHRPLPPGYFTLLLGAVASMLWTVPRAIRQQTVLATSGNQMKLSSLAICLCISCVLAATQNSHGDVVLNNINLWNYTNGHGFGGGNDDYTGPVSGLFEFTANGIKISTDSFRGAGAMTTKQPYSLAGNTVEFTWSGSGGSSFMQPVLGHISTQRDADPGAQEIDFINASYGNSFNGSWVAAPNRLYKTSVSISATSYNSVTTEVDTGTVVEIRSGIFDYSSPLRILFRQGDTYDFQNSHLYLKDIRIKNTGALSGAVWSISDGGNGHYYELATSSERITWDTAQAQATQRGGYLADDHFRE